jgi:Cu+-exporting ATPase
MVACPCALALAAPFTYGSVLRVFGRNKLYLKNADIVEKLADIDAVVFDKTGTITHGDTPDVSFEGSLNSLELSRIKTLTSYSTHPLSIIISKSITLSSPESVTEFKELPGQGIEGIINRIYIKVGSASFVGCNIQSSPSSATVFVRIDDRLVGRFIVKNAIRTNLGAMLKKLGRRKLSLLSGDNESEKALMKSVFHSTANLFFNQSPHDKMAYVENLQKQGSKVLMVGDGLNDAGALRKSDVGLAVSDNTGIFSPACDGILLGEKLHKLDKYLELAKASSVILKIAFGLSFFYNAIALSFAVTGNLTPLVAAILMPISSISVVSFSSIAVNFVANRKIGT